MKKIIKLMALMLVVLMAFTACSGSDSSSSSSSSASAASQDEAVTLKLGMIAQIYGTQSFNDDIRDGIEAVSEKYGFENICLEVPDIADAGNSLRTLIAQGVNFIVVGSAEYADAMVEVALEYPDVKFLYLNEADGMPANVMTTVYAEQEGAFLIGSLAALLSQTGNVGSVAAVSGDIVQERFTWGFKAGAEYINPDITVQSAYTNSYTDINKGQEVANAMYSRGADIVSCFAGACNVGVFNAAASVSATFDFSTSHCSITERLGWCVYSISVEIEIMYLEVFSLIYCSIAACVVVVPLPNGPQVSMKPPGR